MIQSYCLDTNILMLLIRGGDRGKQLDQSYGLSRSLNQHVISVVSQGELYALGDANGWGAAKFSAVDAMFRQLVTVDVSSERIVTAYRSIERVNRPKGTPHRKMGQNDMWIAATAIVAGLPLLTTDGDYQHLDGRLLTIHRVK